MPILLISQPDTFSFVRYQLPLVRAAVERGWEVHCALPADAAESVLEAEKGVVLHELAIPRGAGGLIANFSAIRKLKELVRTLQPDVVALIGLKTVFLGGIATLLGPRRPTVNRLLGLGYTFTSSETKAKAIRFVVGRTLGFMLKRPASLTVFENGDDAEQMIEAGLCKRGETVVIPCGVDVDNYPLQPMPPQPISGVYLGRMLRDKGVLDLVAALRLVKQRGHDLPFTFYGGLDPRNPSALSRDEIAAWEREGLIEYAGFSENIPDVWRRHHFIVLPSYREGLPVAVLEAAASGRLAVVSDVPGCRDAVLHGESGFYVPPADPESLANVLVKLLGREYNTAAMGQAGRAHMVARFHAPNLAAELVGQIETLTGHRSETAPQTSEE